MVLAMLTRHFRQLWRVKELCDKRVPPQEIGKAAGINPYFIKGIVEQAKNYGLSEFKGIFERFFETDLALKTSGGKPVNLMECLVMDICGKGAGSQGSVICRQIKKGPRGSPFREKPGKYSASPGCLPVLSDGKRCGKRCCGG